MKEDLYLLLTPVRRRLRFQNGLEQLTFGIIVGGGLCLMLVFFRLFGGRIDITSLIIAATVPAVLSGTAGLLLDQPWRRVAGAIDEYCNLKDRIASALQFCEAPDSAPQQLQVEDAIEHLKGIRARDVIPWFIPRRTGWGIAMVMLGLIACIVPDSAPSGPQGDGLSAATTSAATENISAELNELEQLAEDVDSAQIRDLVNRLRKDLSALDGTDVDIRKALSTVSEMQQKLQDMAAEMNTDAVDARLAEVAEAMNNAETFRETANALKKQQYSKAAESLQNTDASDLSPEEAQPASEKLAEAAAAAEENGLEKLSEAIEDLSQSTAEMNEERLAASAEQLAEEIRRHDVAKKVKNMLKSRHDALAQSKKLLAAESNSEGNGSSADAKGANAEKGKSEQKTSGSSKKAGSKTAGNIDGEKSKLNGELQMAELMGKLGESGESEVETVRTAENQQEATRLAQEAFARYEKMSKAVLDGEAIPHGQRRVIQRYFELIRPDSDTPSDNVAEPVP